MTRAIAAVLLVVAWVATWRPALDPDLWWHVALGDAIRRDGGIPPSEPFSWWTRGEPLVAHSWAWDVAVSTAYDSGGPLGVSVLAMGVSAVIVALLWALIRVSAAGRLGPTAAALTVVVAVVTVVPLWSPRAGMLDLAAVLGVVLAWSLYLRRGTTTVLWVVPLITLAWANLHGSAILAYVVCLAALAVAVPVGIRWGTWPSRPVRPILASAGLAILTACVNPYGPVLWAYPFDDRVASALDPSLDEWRSPDFGSPGLIGLRLVLAVGVAIAIALLGRRRDPLLLVLAATWTFLALGSVRFALIGGPLSVIALAPAAAEATRMWFGARVRSGRDREPVRGPRSPASLAVAGLAAVAIVAVTVTGWRLVAPPIQEGLIADRFPVASVESMRPSCSGRLFNAYDWGGYVAHAWGVPVGAYGNSPGHIVDEQAALENLRVDPQPFLDRQGVDIALLKPDSPIAIWMRSSPGWSVLVEDDTSVAFTRSGTQACQRL